jgi:large subunit ribosomal protein L22
MGARKRNRANQLKEERKNKAFAVLKNCPTSPRKMRLVADLVRGMEVNYALDVLKHTPKEAAGRIEKLLLTAIANWQTKNEGVRIEDVDLYIKEIFVDQGRTLKRIQPAPQGRAHRIRKRSNHVTLVIGSSIEPEQLNNYEEVEVETEENNETN